MFLCAFACFMSHQHHSVDLSFVSDACGTVCHHLPPFLHQPSLPPPSGITPAALTPSRAFPPPYPSSAPGQAAPSRLSSYPLVSGRLVSRCAAGLVHAHGGVGVLQPPVHLVGDGPARRLRGGALEGRHDAALDTRGRGKGGGHGIEEKRSSRVWYGHGVALSRGF